VCDSPDQAAHYHFLDLEAGGLVSDAALGCSQSKEEFRRILNSCILISEFLSSHPLSTNIKMKI
jgi:hypothetical protein